MPNRYSQIIQVKSVTGDGASPAGYTLTTYAGKPLTFSGSIDGVVFVNAPVFDDGKHLYVGVP